MGIQRFPAHSQVGLPTKVPINTMTKEPFDWAPHTSSLGQKICPPPNLVNKYEQQKHINKSLPNQTTKWFCCLLSGIRILVEIVPYLGNVRDPEKF